MWIHNLPSELYNQLVDKTDRNVNKHDKLTWYCPVHGRYEQQLLQRVNYGRGCNRCARSRIVQGLHSSGRIDVNRSKTDFNKRAENYRKNTAHKRICPEWVVNAMANESDKELARQGMINISNSVEFICPNCGKHHSKLLTNIFKASTGEQKYAREGNEIWCRHCAQKSHEGLTEKAVRKWIRDNIDPETTKEKNFFKSLNTRSKYEGDIVLHGCKKVIEIDGEYWHKEEPQEVIDERRARGDDHGQPIGYHKWKDRAIEAAGYKVLHICTEDYDKDPDKYRAIIAEWIENGDCSVKSKFETRE